MKKYPVITVTFALGLAACSAGWITVHDEQFGLSFSHPSTWGQWSQTQIPSQPNTDAFTEMSFSELDRVIQYPEKGRADVNVTMRRYDEGPYRYEEVCDQERSVDLCDTMKQQDLLEEKEDFIKKAAQTIGGVPATIQDFYDVPSGYVVREVQFYTPTHRVHFSAIYDIGGFLIAQSPDDSSLYDTAEKLLGTELSDPINRLSKTYPEELREMIIFYEDVGRLVESIRVHE